MPKRSHKEDMFRTMWNGYKYNSNFRHPYRLREDQVEGFNIFNSCEDIARDLPQT